MPYSARRNKDGEKENGGAVVGNGKNKILQQASAALPPPAQAALHGAQLAGEGFEKLLNRHQGPPIAPGDSGAEGEAVNGSQSAGEQVSSPSSGGSVTPPSIPSGEVAGEEDAEPEASAGEAAAKGARLLFTNFSIAAILPFVLPIIIVIIVVIVIIIIAFTSVVPNALKFDDGLGLSYTTGGVTGEQSSNHSDEQEAFYQRTNNVLLNMRAKGKDFDVLYIAGFLNTLKNHGANIDYDDMTESVIGWVAEGMLDGNVYSETVFKNNLINTIIPKFLPNSSKEEREEMADEIIAYRSEYYNYIGKDPSEASSSYTVSSECAMGACSYVIKGFYIPSRGNVSKPLNISNLYVRLMQCGTYNGVNYGGTFGQPLEGENLIPFEDYVFGVTYGMMGSKAPKEAFKAMMVAVRSYVLSLHVLNTQDGWRTLQKDGNRWILQIANCQIDQIYCNVNQGCSGKGLTTSQIYSGLSHNQGFAQNPLDPKSMYRSYAAQTSGEVITNKDSYIIQAIHQNKEMTAFSNLAKSGRNYKQILFQIYGENTKYKATGVQSNGCVGVVDSCASTGDFMNWKQNVGPWVSVMIGRSGKTIKQIGCLVTSVAMQIARSGTETTVSNFDPGTFVQALNKNNGFNGNGELTWSAVSSVAPGFRWENKVSLSGLSKKAKLNKIREIVNQEGVYVVAEVKGATSRAEHWVAIESVDGDTIRMMDPGSKATDMWAEYPWQKTSQLSIFRAS